MDVQPERLAFDASGTPYSERYGDVYASRDGAVGQARHVFLAGNALPERWRGREQFVVLETGFGIGVNFLATWQQWKLDTQRCRRLHFVSIERHPLPATDLIAAAPAELRPLATELAAHWPLPLAGLHRCEFEAGAVVLTLAFGDARSIARHLAVGADAIYLDGFAPDRNAEMWEPAVLKAIARCARPGATLATWTTARTVRDTLVNCGFALETRRGFGRKREMLTARYAPAWKVRRHEPPAAYRGERSAIVIGAGIAGSACAEALGRRGWTVQVLDRAPQAASAGSSQPAGLLHPALAVDDARLARLTRAGMAFSEAALNRSAPDGRHNSIPVWRRDGAAQLADDAATLLRWDAAIEQQALPPEFVECLDAATLRDRVGLMPPRGGLWWPRATTVAPRAWCAALLAAAGIQVNLGTTVSQLQRDGSDWNALDSDGHLLGRAAAVIVASAFGAPLLLRSKIALQEIHGRLTLLDRHVLEGLRAPLTGDGYLLRGLSGELAIGATYERALPDGMGLPQLSEDQATASNLVRLSRLLAEPPAVRPLANTAGVRCVARDRLPLAGPAVDEASVREQQSGLAGAHLDDLPRQAGLYGCYALASRGLTLAPALAELIAAQIEGEPLPLERDLVHAVDPARFLLHALRRTRG
ncbi:MAG TPA: bifunctional tRNA (5-methylaminomethyl-2-thiouridine)(34)-methyltransferase MnmD/FAD-dependent 5-carboxymethylaminomethyl-2-thiouridine(34) oxidoreductase MnmC [Burkholderiaceae bacterium]|nr:bifunctional tRNA (5-methylaminomethyl-2-thiouridine)(34)-methyltransferase MnmD/FAD-dependent 5-carboxymethylaminomethyl-2-thiouridine(34) oxidoreductase MnmC [Burkholderiaceae bacterium]